MSESTTASAGTAAAAPGRKPPGAKYAGLTRNQWILVGGVFVVVAGVIIWRRHAAAAAAPASSSTGSGECTDSTGASVPCDQADNSGDLAALETELESLLAAEGQAGGSGGGGTVPVPSGGTGTGTGSGSTSGTGTGSGTTSSSGSGSSSGTGTTVAKKIAPTQVGGVHSTKVSPTSVTIAWNKNPNATSYQIRVTYQGKLVGGVRHSTGTSVTISGLTPNHTYGIHVAGVNSVGTGPEGTYDVKTPRS